jgi:hypothetical protein
MLDTFAPTINALETKEAYLYEGDLYIRHEFRDPEEMQTRMRYVKVGPDNVVSDENIVLMGVWGKVRKAGERVK